MTIPRVVREAPGKLTDMIAEMMPKFLHRLTPTEQRIGIHLRGNDDLLEGLQDMISERMGRRAALPVPSDPILCKAVLERDAELRWLRSRLEFIHRSPVAQSVDSEREQPA